MSYTHNLSLDLNAQPNGVYIYAKEGDMLSRYLSVTIIRDGIKYTPTETVLFRAEKPDGHAVINTGTIEEDGTVTVELTAQTLAVAGRIKCDIALVDGTDVVSTSTFVIIANHMPDVADQTESSNEFKFILESIENFDEKVATEVSAYIEEHHADIATKSELDSLSETIAEHGEALAAQSAVIAEQQRVNDRQNKQIDTLYKILDGQELDFDTQTQTAYEIPVESAKGKVVGCALDMLGGMSKKSKNILNCNPTQGTSNGVSYAKNADGTYTLNGTATSTGLIGLNTINLPVGTYKIVGCPSGGSESTYGIRLRDSANRHDYGNGYVATYSAPTDVTVSILVFSGYTFNNVIFKPMITTDTTATYNDYEPHFDGIRSAQSSEIVSKDSNGDVMQSVAIPQDCPVLHGINGSVYDYLEFADDKVLLHKRVGVVDLGTLPLVYYATTSRFYCIALSTYGMKAPANNNTAFNGISSLYSETSYSAMANDVTKDKYVALTADGTMLTFRDVAYNDASLVGGKAPWLDGVPLYYELATEQIIDITDIFANFDNLIEVDDGGTLTFKNSAENEAQGIHIPVPSTITLPVRLGA